MNNLHLETVDVNAQKYQTIMNPYDVRRDLTCIVSYFRKGDVKRSCYGNNLSKSDFNKMAKILGYEPTAQEKRDGLKWIAIESWIENLDLLAKKLKWITYDTKGTYAGYTSREASFPANYIQFKEKNYQAFLELSLYEQEKQILDAMVQDSKDRDEYFLSGDNEFYRNSPLGCLDGFNAWGCATGIMRTLKFEPIRRFLFDILQNLESGVWYSTASLIAYLKKNHRFFLIPKKLPKESAMFRGPEKLSRYMNFQETVGKQLSQGKIVSETDADAFERVEGRYVERFLEDIPLTMGYVDVAYTDDYNRKIFPQIQRLKAFRVHESFLQFMANRIPEPKVTVMPNFEIHLESAFYPINLMNILLPITDLVSRDKVTVLKLQKNKIVPYLTNNTQFDLTQFLTNIARREIPQNVAVEIKEWAGHSDAFTLYEGFGLWEGNHSMPFSSQFVEENLSSHFALVRRPQKLIEKLEQSGFVPISIQHEAVHLQPIPEYAKTAFPKMKAKPKSKSPKAKPAPLRWETIINLYFPNEQILERFCQEFLKAGCVIDVEKKKFMVQFKKQEEKKIKEVIKTLQKEFAVKIETNKEK